MTRPQVSLLRHDVYEPDSTVEAVRRLLVPLGGMERFVSSGARVLLKPNLVYGRHPDKAVNTHPSIVRAAAVLAREAGASWIGIGDSPGYGSALSAAKGCGLKVVADELGAEIVEFTPYVDVSNKRAFARLELAAEIRDADVVVNLPKMKTHSQMLMTLAVKNMFGAVPGPRKFQWHYRAGRDWQFFARAINEIATTARPHLNILDAVEGMDGAGPTSGRARAVGFLAAGDDPWALDAAVMDVLGRPRTDLYVLAAAERHGPREWLDAELFGDAPETLCPADWRYPETQTLQMHGGFVERRLPWLSKWLRARLSPCPVPNRNCIACGYCVEICPAKAMRLDGGSVVIDDAACIRCYCCHELCQYDGMNMPGPGLLGRLLGL